MRIDTLVILILVPVFLKAGPGTISGTMVLDDGQPAMGGSVVLTGTRYGAAVDSLGAFLLTDIPPGEYSLEGRLIGYEQKDGSLLRVRGDDTLHVHLELWENAIEMRQIDVSGLRRQGAEDVRPSVTTLSPRESKILPGAAEDVLRSLQSLPGVTSVSDYSSQLVVRGSGPDQNLITIDGFEVLNPYRLYGFVSMFNPETISSISLQTGGFGAEYGDRLSAVLDVRNREGKNDVAVSGKLNTSLTNLNGIFEGGLAGSSYLISLRRTYYDLILGPILKSAKLVQGDVALPNFRDLQMKLSSPIDENNKLLLNLFTSRDGVDLVSGVDRNSPDSVNLFDNSYNTLVGATWQYAPTVDIIATTQLSWYRNSGGGFFDGTFVDPTQNTGDVGRADTLGIRYVNFGVQYDYRYQKISLTQRALYTTGDHTVEAGYGIDWLRTDFTRYFHVDEILQEIIRSRGQVVPTDAVVTNSYNRENLFVQDRIALGDRLFLQPGVRLDVYPLLSKTAYVSPRLNLSLKLDDLSTLRAAYGMYVQSPGMEKEDFRNRIVFTRESLGQISAERADHFILGADRMVSPEWQLKVETYYKQFTGIIVPEKVQGSRWLTQQTGADVFSPAGWTTPVLVAGDSLTNRPVNDGTGASYGFEFLMQKIRSAPGDRFSGWVSYALSYANRKRDDITTPFLFDQRHAVNVVGNYRLGERWEIGAKFTLRSGRPFVSAVGVKPRVVYRQTQAGVVPVVQLDANGRVILDVNYEQDANSGRLNLYHSLDVRITTYPRWWGLNWSAYLDVQNVYNRENQQQMNYFLDNEGNIQERPVYGIPIFPSLGMSVTF